MYNYSVNDCDVQDKDRLEKFRAKRKEWVNWLKGSDPHSIWRQISQLLWDEAFLRTIHDLYRAASETPSPSVGFNLDVLRLLQVGFITTQVAAIRRLTDPRSDVISMKRLINDIKENRALITREIYVCYDGRPYSVNPPRLVPGWQETTGANAYHMSEITHEYFDRLSGVLPSNRSRDDLIMEKWFDYVDARLRVCDDIRTFVNKFVAHAADPASRAGLSRDQTVVTPEEIRLCLRAIFHIASFISGPLLFESSFGTVPVPQYNHLEHMDKSWVASVEYAQEFWRKNVAEIEKWAREGAWPKDPS